MDEQDKRQWEQWRGAKPFFDQFAAGVEPSGATEPCIWCNGTGTVGRAGFDPIICHRCNGTGMMPARLSAEEMKALIAQSSTSEATE